MVLLILIGAMIVVGVPLYIHYRISGSPSANAPMPRAQSSWHHHHPTGKAKRPVGKKQPQNNALPKDNQAKTKDSDSTLTSATASATASASATLNQNSQGQTSQEVSSASPTVSANQGRQYTQSQVETPLRKEDLNDAQENIQENAQEEESEVCCGLHEVCEKLATNSNKVEYFDDEELDQFAGRNPEDYNDSEIDLFRDVMTTMYPSEVALWRQSLGLRGIAFPVELEDEFMLILSEV